MLSLNEKLRFNFYAYERPFMHCLYFICERKFYASTRHATLEINRYSWDFPLTGIIARI